MTVTIGDIDVSNPWTTENNPAVWDKSSILDLLTISVDFTTDVDITTSGEILFNPALFREVGTLYTGSVRPSKGYYLDASVGVGTHNMIETGVLPQVSNYETVECEITGANEFTIHFTFRMLADRNDFITDVSMSNADRLLKNSIDASNQLENVVSSVYNKIKELQLYVYVKDNAGDVDTVLVRQQMQAKFYGEDSAFSWDTIDFCSLYGDNDFEFEYDPTHAGVSSDYQKIKFKSAGQNLTYYEADLDFEDVDLSTNTSAGDSFTFTFADYDTSYYVAVVYNVDDESYTEITELLESECLPDRVDVGVHGHVKDYMGGTSALGTPCTALLSYPTTNPGSHWWTPIRNASYVIEFDGSLATPTYTGVFPVNGEIVEEYLGSYFQGWVAKASPSGVYEYQHDASATVQRDNFVSHINTYFSGQWTAVVQGASACVLTRVFPNGYLSNNYTLGYKLTSGSSVVDWPVNEYGTDLSSVTIYDQTRGVTVTFDYTDVPSEDDLAAVVDYINNNTIYDATAGSGGWTTCMPLGSYSASDIAASYVRLITSLVEPINSEFFSGGALVLEDNTIQVVSERLCSVAVWVKEVYDDAAALEDYYNDTDTDLKKIRFEVDGEEYEAVKSLVSGSYVWTTNNDNFTVEDTATEVTATFCYRGLFDNDQGTPDWANTTQEPKFTFVLEYSQPKTYTWLVEYAQEVEFKEFDDGASATGEVIERIDLYDATGTYLINNICDHDTVVARVYAWGAAPGTYKIVVLIGPEPYGVSLESDQALEEEDSWVGALTQLSTTKITVINENLTSASLAQFEIDTTKLDKTIRWRVYAIAYEQ